MNKYLFLSCFLIFPRILFAQAEPRFYLYNYFLLHDEQGNVEYKTDHSAVTKRVFEEMGKDPEYTVDKIKIPSAIINKEIYPKPEENVFYFDGKQFAEARVTKIYLQYDETMRRYVPAFDYVKVSKGGGSMPTAPRTTKNVPIELFIFVPDKTRAGESPTVLKADPILKKSTLKQIKAIYKGQDSEWSAPKLQFISVMNQKYVVSRIDSELVIALDVYKIENGVLKRICGESFDLFT